MQEAGYGNNEELIRYILQLRIPLSQIYLTFARAIITCNLPLVRLIINLIYRSVAEVPNNIMVMRELVEKLRPRLLKSNQTKCQEVLQEPESVLPEEDFLEDNVPSGRGLLYR